MLSWVELYRPSYFLIENVIGMLFHPLGGEQSGRSVVGGVKMGMVKFIVRAATALGYVIFADSSLVLPALDTNIMET